MRPKRKDRHFRFAAFAVIPVCLLAMFMIINVVQAAVSSKSTADAVTLEVSGDSVKVTVTVDNASDEKLTAVSLALDVDIKKGENTADFSFAEALKDTVYGSRYEGNTLYLYVAGQDVIFDENDTIFLGELSLGDNASTDAMSATVSYKEGSLEVANSAFGSRALLTVKSDAVSVDKESTTTQPETTTEKPSQPETTTERPSQPETTERPSQPETTTERPSQPETTTERPSQPETTTEKPSQTETTASGNKQSETNAGNSGQSGTAAADNRQQETTTSANNESETTTSANRQSETTTAVNQGNVQPTTTGSTQSETTVQNPESTQETDTTAQEKTSEEIQMMGKNNASSFGGIKLVLILAAVVVVLVGAGFVLYLNLKK